MMAATPFLGNTFRIFASEDPDIKAACGWGHWNGKVTIKITDQGKFAKVLSGHFKHGNISTFVRQLNMYGFHKTHDSKTQEFYHSKFL